MFCTGEKEREREGVILYCLVGPSGSGGFIEHVVMEVGHGPWANQDQPIQVGIGMWKLLS
jgi:hypothetical protein